MRFVPSTGLLLFVVSVGCSSSPSSGWKVSGGDSDEMTGEKSFFVTTNAPEELDAKGGKWRPTLSLKFGSRSEPELIIYTGAEMDCSDVQGKCAGKFLVRFDEEEAEKVIARDGVYLNPGNVRLPLRLAPRLLDHQLLRVEYSEYSYKKRLVRFELAGFRDGLLKACAKAGPTCSKEKGSPALVDLLSKAGVELSGGG